MDQRLRDDATLHAFDKSAGKLGVDRLDLLLLHQPLPSRFDLTLDAYRALEKLLTDGTVRSMGVSNFMPEHLRAVPTRWIDNDHCGGSNLTTGRIW